MTVGPLLVALVALLLVSSIALAQDPREAANRATYLRVSDEAFQLGNMAVLDEVTAPDFVAHTPNGDVPVEGSKATISALRGAMPDLISVPEIVITEGDYVAARTVVSGTFTGPLVLPDQTIPPNGEPVYYAMNQIQRYDEDGKLAEEWLAWDNLALFAQLGVAPGAPMTPISIVAWELDVEPAGAADAEAAHEAALQQVADEAFNVGNWDLLDTLVARDYVLHSPLGHTDLATSKVIFSGLRDAMPDMTMTREIMVSEGDWSAARTVIRGTFTNEYMTPNGPLPPTNGPVVLDIINFFHFDEDGRATEEWAEHDNLSFLTQLGALGAAGATPEATAEVITAS